MSLAERNLNTGRWFPHMPTGRNRSQREKPARAKPQQRVLVVDDDTSLLRALRRLLRSAGYEVFAFRSAEDFLAQYVPGPRACLLLDIFLPGMNGLDLWARMNAAHQGIPTVMMTARDEETVRTLSGGAEVVTVLYKPFDEEALMRSISEAFKEG